MVYWTENEHLYRQQDLLTRLFDNILHSYMAGVSIDDNDVDDIQLHRCAVKWIGWCQLMKETFHLNTAGKSSLP